MSARTELNAAHAGQVDRGPRTVNRLGFGAAVLSRTPEVAS